MVIKVSLLQNLLKKPKKSSIKNIQNARLLITTMTIVRTERICLRWTKWTTINYIVVFHGNDIYKTRMERIIMITKEAIKNGFEKGVISIEDDYAGCLGACCRIGDNAFYFIDAEDAYLTKEEYWKSYTLNMTINMIFNVLKNVEAAEENGIDYAELAYYEAVLTTNFFL